MDVLIKIDPDRGQTTEVLYPICEVYCADDAPSISGGFEFGQSEIKLEDTNYIIPNDSIKEERREFKCTLCSMAFKNRYHLNRHMRTHTDIRDFKCEVCNAMFKRKEHLARHTENVHYDLKKDPLQTDNSEIRFKCNFCNENFPFENMLEEHVKIHIMAKEIGFKLMDDDPEQGTGIKRDPPPKGPKQHICLVCTASFTRNHHLQRHMLSHSDIREHECPTCHSMFRRKEHLHRHQFVHSEVRAYKCQYCEKTFKRREHLFKHQSRHANMWRPFELYNETEIEIVQ